MVSVCSGGDWREEEGGMGRGGGERGGWHKLRQQGRRFQALCHCQCALAALLDWLGCIVRCA